MTDDDEPTAEELAEAEALARALEAPGAGAPAPAPARPAPEDALATAALLRHARAHASEGARVPAAAARALAALAARRPPHTRTRARWLVPALLASGAAATIMLLVATRGTSERAVPASLGARALPAPTVELLRAQARAATGGEDLGSLDRDMRAYRAAFYAALATRERGGR